MIDCTIPYRAIYRRRSPESCRCYVASSWFRSRASPESNTTNPTSQHQILGLGVPKMVQNWSKRVSGIGAKLTPVWSCIYSKSRLHNIMDSATTHHEQLELVGRYVDSISCHQLRNHDDGSVDPSSWFRSWWYSGCVIPKVMYSGATRDQY